MPTFDLNQTLFVDQAHAGHRHAEEIRRHFCDAVKGRLGWGVEDLVPSERIYAPGLVLEGHGVHDLEVEQTPASVAGSRRSLSAFSFGARSEWLSSKCSSFAWRWANAHGTKYVCLRPVSEPNGDPVRTPLILFDGVCNLCNGWVSFIIRRDPNGIFRFAAQQTPAGRGIVRDYMRNASPLPSVILIDDNAIYAESDAILQIFGRLAPPWSWIALLRIIPRRVRDACYHFVARHRYQWFGRTEVCPVPSADIRSRFIE